MAGDFLDGGFEDMWNSPYVGLEEVLPEGWPTTAFLQGDIRDTMAASDRVRGGYDRYDSSPDDEFPIDYVPGYQFLKGNAES